jgi:hypothetical protein
MSLDPPGLEVLRIKSNEIKAAIGTLGDMRPGSLVEWYRKCGKPNCHCAKKGAPGHGPTWLVTRAVDGKTVTKQIPVEALELTRSQIEHYHRFRDLSHDLVDTNDRICDLRLKQQEANAPVSVKKNRARRNTARRSR